MTRFLVFIAIFCVNVYGYSFKGDVAFQNYVYDFDKINDKDTTIQDINLNAELKIKKENYDLFSKINILYDSEDKHRRYLSFDEVYFKYYSDNYEASFGKDIRFWGALELYNITDIYNQKNILDDIFDKNKKLGTSNISYKYFFENSEISIILKTNEEKQSMPSQNSGAYMLPGAYDEDYVINNEHKNSDNFQFGAYVKYDGNYDGIFQGDFSYIFYHGYDSNRHILPSSDKLVQILFEVDKLSTYQTFVYENTIIKAELSATKVKDYEAIDDYYQAGLGVEHTIDNIIGKSTLGILAEYYKSDASFFENYKNDLFYGLRYSLNDTKDSSLLAGFVQNIDNKSKSYEIKYETRIYDIVKIDLSMMGNDDFSRVNFDMGYYF